MEELDGERIKEICSEWGAARGMASEGGDEEERCATCGRYRAGDERQCCAAVSGSAARPPPFDHRTRRSRGPGRCSAVADTAHRAFLRQIPKEQDAVLRDGPERRRSLGLRSRPGRGTRGPTGHDRPRGRRRAAPPAGGPTGAPVPRAPCCGRRLS
jgi:hypothetical protein